MSGSRSTKYELIVLHTGRPSSSPRILEQKLCGGTSWDQQRYGNSETPSHSLNLRRDRGGIPAKVTVGFKGHDRFGGTRLPCPTRKPIIPDESSAGTTRRDPRSSTSARRVVPSMLVSLKVVAGTQPETPLLQFISIPTHTSRG